MQDFRPLWKERANDKSLSFYDCIQRCILVGMHAGDDFDDKVRIAMWQLDRAFTKSSSHGYDRLYNGLRYASRPYIGIASGVLETDVEKIEFEKIGDAMRETKNWQKLGVHYCYIFMFGELIPEQTLVQGMHAAMLMGQRLTEEQAWPRGVSAENLHFVIAKPHADRGEIARQLIANNLKFTRFDDYDYSFNEAGELVQNGHAKSLKTIMTYPISTWKKKPFTELELLRFESDGPNQRAV